MRPARCPAARTDCPAARAGIDPAAADLADLAEVLTVLEDFLLHADTDIVDQLTGYPRGRPDDPPGWVRDPAQARRRRHVRPHPDRRTLMNVLNPALHDTLRTLKLTGMLDTLDARVAQARTGALGHLDFLQVLCEDEIARRETAALARRLRLARFEEQATIESFDFTANPKVPAAALRDLAALRWLDAGESVILYGPTGVGKTHVAQGLGHNVIRRGGQVRFVKTSRVLADLAGGHADRTWERRLREYTRPAVVILDDFAMRELTAPQADDLYELVSERAIASRPLILTSNRAPTDWYALFHNPVVAESLLDRLINTSHQVLMDGPSYRPRKRPRPAGRDHTNTIPTQGAPTVPPPATS